MTIPIVQDDLMRRVQSMEQAGVPVVAPSEETPASVAYSPEAAASFASLLAQNEAYRKAQSEAWEKREKESRSRKTLAAISDALSSLSNLVGTRYGAFSQPQTYQMPFINRETEQERALARATADRIRATEAAAYGNGNNPYALENLKHQHKMEQMGAKAGYDSKLESQKQENRKTLKDMYYEYKGNYDDMMAELKRHGIQISRERLNEAIRHNTAMETLREQYGGGNVGGYTTQTTINRNEYGQETGRTTTRTPAPRPGKKKNPMN